MDTGKKVTKLPHASEYAKWRKKISDADYEKVVERICNTIEGIDVNTAGWIPDSNWIGTPYEAIYYACGQNEIQAGFFFDLNEGGAPWSGNSCLEKQQNMIKSKQ